MRKIVLPLFLLISLIAYPQKELQLRSPDRNIQVTVTIGEIISYTVDFNKDKLLLASPLSLTLEGLPTLGVQPEIKDVSRNKVKQQVELPFYIHREVLEKYNEMEIHFEGDWSLVFRAYNNAVAYRFKTNLESTVAVMSEQVVFNFPATSEITYANHPWESMQTSCEAPFRTDTLGNLKTGYFSWPPFLVRPNGTDAGSVILVSEADLFDYPGMFLEVTEEKTLMGRFPAYPKEVSPGGWQNFNMKVRSREEYLAQTQGTRDYPWRYIIIEHEDIRLLENSIPYLLTTPSKIEDISWIQPGLVAWDWWSDMNLDNVPFKTGVNTETYKYYIDFAAKHGIPYVNLDEGWSDQYDLLKLNPDLDLDEIIRYAKEKNVKLILWCVWYVLDRQMDEALDMFEKWGIHGLKIDFIDRSDQYAVNFYERCARELARRKIAVNFHGAMHPTGMERTWPNILTREGVLGMEFNKFGYLDQKEGVHPPHNVTIPFIRNVAGPMDYTPGAMRNVNKDAFIPVFSKPVSPGTRAHQLAMYVVYFSALQMLSDAPTAYEKEPEIISILSKVPVVWDQTIALAGKTGEQVVVARRHGDDWWIGGMTNYNEYTAEISLEFLGKGSYKALVYRDGVNTHRNATDYVREESSVGRKDTLTLTMVPGGGFLIHLKKE